MSLKFFQIRSKSQCQVNLNINCKIRIEGMLCLSTFDTLEYFKSLLKFLGLFNVSSLFGYSFESCASFVGI